MNEVLWHCPECNQANIDSMKYTVFPVCENCLKDFTWAFLEQSGKVEAIEEDD